MLSYWINDSVIDSSVFFVRKRDAHTKKYRTHTQKKGTSDANQQNKRTEGNEEINEAIITSDFEVMNARLYAIRQRLNLSNAQSK